MRYALNLGEDGRILSATYEQYAMPGNAIVDALPEGENISDYLYVDGEYIYEPLPVEEVVYEPSAEELLNALLGVTSYE